MLEKTLENPLDSKIKPVNPKGNQPWIFIGRTDAEAPILWPPDAKSWFIGKDPDTGKDCRQKEKGVTEMIGWHHQLNGHEFEQTPEVSGGQKSLACCSLCWCRVRYDLVTEQQQPLVITSASLLSVKVTQSCPTLCDLHGLYSPWNSPSQNTAVGSLSLL